MKNKNEKEALWDKIVCKAVRASLNEDVLTWPPTCPFIAYQPFRPKAKPNTENKS